MEANKCLLLSPEKARCWGLSSGVCVRVSSKVKMKPRPQQRGGLKSPCILAHRSQKL